MLLLTYNPLESIRLSWDAVPESQGEYPRLLCILYDTSYFYITL